MIKYSIKHWRLASELENYSQEKKEVLSGKLNDVAIKQSMGCNTKHCFSCKGYYRSKLNAISPFEFVKELSCMLTEIHTERHRLA